MEQGSTFLRTDSDDHLWVVLSDPVGDPEHVLLVNMTTFRAPKERACVLNRGDHPWITHETCINYGDAVVTTTAKLLEAKDGGAIKLQATLALAILRRILNGVMDSTRISLENAELLKTQGLIDF